MSKQETEERLFVQHVRIVALALHRLRVRGRARALIDQEDLFQWGCIGLLHALRRFDPSRGLKFVTYAYRCVRGQMLDGLRLQVWGKRSQRSAKQLSESKPGVPLYPDQLEIEWEGLAADRDLGPLGIAMVRDAGAAFLRRLGGLPIRERTMALERIDGLTFAEIGRRHGVTDSRVHQILNRMLPPLARGIDRAAVIDYYTKVGA